MYKKILFFVVLIALPLIPIGCDGVTTYGYPVTIYDTYGFNFLSLIVNIIFGIVLFTIYKKFLYKKIQFQFPVSVVVFTTFVTALSSLIIIVLQGNYISELFLYILWGLHYIGIGIATEFDQETGHVAFTISVVIYFIAAYILSFIYRYFKNKKSDK